MGLFDDLICKYPLPVEGANDLAFQTQDTPAQYMDKYEIREDGTLWHEKFDTEDRSNPDADDELDRFVGQRTHVNERWEFCEFTGSINFYSSLSKVGFGCDRGWVEFIALFVHGKIIHLELMEHTQPKEKAIA
jgi:hypothetical protein